MDTRTGLKLKICGMKQPGNLQAIAALQPDYLGFIFYPKSKRFMGDTLSPEQLAGLPSAIKKTGVFVNADAAYILEQAKAYGLDMLQLHGDESPEECAALQGKGYKLVKAFGVDSGFDFSQLKAYAAVTDYYLFDTKGPAYGGNGIVFDWSVLEQYDQHKPFFLSGGIGLEELRELEKLKDMSQLHALDVNSRFELEPGLKDVDLLEQLKERWQDWI